MPLTGVPCIGDSYRDIAAGITVGCRPILVRTGNGNKTLLEHPELIDQIEVVSDLAAAADLLIKE
jgi:D-glycero-D-manno-heptose 1,7-bisphosphate phosphatase